MDRDRLAARAGAVTGVYQTIAAVVIVLGILAMVAGFIQAVADADDTFAGVMSGTLAALAILVFVVVAWAGVQMFALMAGYIHQRTRRDFN